MNIETRLLWYITLLELNARIGRKNLKYYVQGHANRLRAMVTGDFKKYGIGDNYNDINAMSRSIFELSLRWTDSPDVDTRRWHTMAELIRVYARLKYDVIKRES